MILKTVGIVGHHVIAIQATVYLDGPVITYFELVAGISIMDAKNFWMWRASLGHSSNDVPSCRLRISQDDHKQKAKSCFGLLIN